MPKNKTKKSKSQVKKITWPMFLAQILGGSPKNYAKK